MNGGQDGAGLGTSKVVGDAAKEDGCEEEVQRHADPRRSDVKEPIRGKGKKSDEETIEEERVLLMPSHGTLKAGQSRTANDKVHDKAATKML